MKRVLEQPPLPTGIEAGAQRAYLSNLARSLAQHLGAVGTRANQSVPKDGSEPQRMVSYEASDFPTITADVHDADLGYYAVARVVLSGGSFDLTGIADGAGQEGAGGRVQRIINASASALTLTLKHENAGSVAENRMLLPSAADYPIPQFAAACLWYDLDASRWRISV